MQAVLLFLALLLALSAAHKLAAPQRMGEAAARLAGAPSSLGPALAFAAAGIEGTAALALLLEPTRLGGAVAAAVLWSGYGVLLFIRRGQTLDCGCDLARRSKRVGWQAIVRPLLLAALALCAVLPPFDLAWRIDTPFAALALLALWFAAAELGAISIPARSR